MTLKIQKCKPDFSSNRRVLKPIMIVGSCLAAIMILLIVACPAFGQISCTEGIQDSGSIYRICMPPPGTYNGNLIIWVHGFQNADEPIGIPFKVQGDRLKAVLRK